MPLLQWGAVLGATLAAAVVDARSRRIPNSLTLPLAVSGFITSIVYGGAAGGLDSFAACLLLAFPYVLLFVFAGGGAGDAKLMGAIGAWLGLVHGAVVLALVSLCGIILAFVYAFAQRRAGQVVASVHGFARGATACILGGISLESASALLPASSGARKLPYGLAICAGTLISAIGVFLWRDI